MKNRQTEIQHISQQQVRTAAGQTSTTRTGTKKEVTKANRHILQTSSDWEIVWDGFRSGDCLPKPFTHVTVGSIPPSQPQPFQLWGCEYIVWTFHINWHCDDRLDFQKATQWLTNDTTWSPRDRLVHRQFTLVPSQEWIVRPASCYANLLQSIRL